MDSSRDVRLSIKDTRFLYLMLVTALVSKNRSHSPVTQH